MSQETANEAWTIGRLLRWTTGWFEQHGVDAPRLSAELLLAHTFGCKKIELYTRFEHVANPEQLTTMRELVRKAAEHMPVAYLIGRKEFFSLEFEVSPAVLIPRPETETLVQRVIDLCRARPDEPLAILDLGTGSGCIAVAIAKYVPTADLVASDASAEAVEIARHNAERHGVAERIAFCVADGLALEAAVVPLGGFDVIASNPPYIAEADFDALPRNVRDYEPRASLTLPGSDGLAFYRRLAAECGGCLKPDGSILVEIGHDQSQSVPAIFAETRHFTHVGTYRDPTDPHDRVVHFQRTGA
ncbi:MAG: peptide chain release factor N(5)-glutamine methyltransferase [Phycisphaerae bacterium]|nr:peptide chain release factor N(5)-glutamine methyltransferase [Phycisphaerae bacterium]